MIEIMPGAIEQLFEGSAHRRHKAGHMLFHSGDPVSVMYLVVEGRVHLERATRSGDPMILQRAEAGEVIAEASAYSAAYHCDARAATAVTLHTLTVRRFRDRLAQDSRLAGTWSAHLAHAVQVARTRAEIRTLRTVADRLDAWLGGGRHLPQRGEWQLLASELGVSREALYRELAKRR